MKSSTNRLRLWIWIVFFTALHRLDFEVLYAPVMAAENSHFSAYDGKLSYLPQANHGLDETVGPGADLILIADTAQDSVRVLQKTEAETSTIEPSSPEDREDYMVPKTVYMGVDSIVAPEVLPETAALPLSAGTAAQADGSKGTDSPAISATTVSPVKTTGSATSTAAGISSTVEGSLSDNDYAIQPLEGKINAVSEVEVPTGLPEDLIMDEDHADVANLTGALKDNTKTAVGTPAQLTQDERIKATGKPAVVSNLDDRLQINRQNEWGWTKLITAAIDGDLEKTNKLLGQGADPDIVGNDGRSPLMAASWNRHYAVVEALLSAGADVNLRNRDGWTALSFAAWNGDIEIVNSLLRVSANKLTETVDGFTPLQLAQLKGHQEIVAILE